MSNRVRFACIDHSPPIRMEVEYASHGEIDEMREVHSNRDDWGDLVDDDRIQIVHDGCRRAAEFFNEHPLCKFAIVDEYEVWTDLGDGLPRGVKTAEPAEPAVP